MHTATVGKALNLLDAVPCLTSPDRMTLGNNTLAFLKVITIQKEGQEERRKEDQEEVIVYNSRVTQEIIYLDMNSEYQGVSVKSELIHELAFEIKEELPRVFWS